MNRAFGRGLQTAAVVEAPSELVDLAEVVDVVLRVVGARQYDHAQKGFSRARPSMPAGTNLTCSAHMNAALSPPKQTFRRKVQCPPLDPCEYGMPRHPVVNSSPNKTMQPGGTSATPHAIHEIRSHSATPLQQLWASNTCCTSNSWHCMSVSVYLYRIVTYVVSHG